ncbi:hypothetical protein TSUD_367450 [Trifolium subterraneum]|uniref:Reverse transcriptase domain-containing protein n=1 Tax=Trifolium subterraneum TaxID=3900 RepID=A0A2Z6NY96_TRISU|nr:hypothetical protein TSUD_367450 [Trifolium subterraneum]
MLLKTIDASIFQRSRVKWLKEGDANSKYFHSTVKTRGRVNKISALLTESSWVEGPSNVRQATISFFQNHFANVEWERPTLDGLEFPMLSDDSNNLLIAPFTIEEIEEAVKECDGSKCPGLDGFNFAFIKEFWALIKHESAFLKGSQLVEGVVVVNEVIDFAKKAGKGCLILKVVFEKAYDSADWDFLDYMLGRFGFCPKWRAWMKACVWDGNVSVLVNGSPTQEIPIKRGLKQGDPLAPPVSFGLYCSMPIIRSILVRLRLKTFVLNAIPIFYLSYMKMPAKVWRQLVKIQRNFLWEGLSNRSKTCWVKWDDICRPKNEVGFCIRDLRLVNTSLLAKWRWKFLSHEEEVWKEIVKARYGSDVIENRCLGTADIPRCDGEIKAHVVLVENACALVDFIYEKRFDRAWAKKLRVKVTQDRETSLLKSHKIRDFLAQAHKHETSLLKSHKTRDFLAQSHTRLRDFLCSESHKTKRLTLL